MENVSHQIVYEFLKKLPVEDVVNYCSTNRKLRQLCYGPLKSYVSRRKNIHKSILDNLKESGLSYFIRDIISYEPKNAELTKEFLDELYLKGLLDEYIPAHSYRDEDEDKDEDEPAGLIALKRALQHNNLKLVKYIIEDFGYFSKKISGEPIYEYVNFSDKNMVKYILSYLTLAERYKYIKYVERRIYPDEEGKEMIASLTKIIKSASPYEYGMKRMNSEPIFALERSRGKNKAISL